MTTTEKAATAERLTLVRCEARIARAYGAAFGIAPDSGVPRRLAELEIAILTASAKALFPGQQKRRHVIPALKIMVAATCRVIRRGVR